jgi:hypothetical protein
MSDGAERIWNSASKGARAALVAKVLASLSKGDVLRYAREHDEEHAGMAWENLGDEVRAGVSEALGRVVSELGDGETAVLDLLATRSGAGTLADVQSGIADVLVNLAVKR